MFQDRLASAEVLWAQKYNAKSGGRPAAVYTVCYCCGGRGHYSRDCSELATARCNYCHKVGHKEVVCRQKQRSHEENARAGGSGTQHGEASFFHGRPAECNVISFGTRHIEQVSTSPLQIRCSGTEPSQSKCSFKPFISSDKWLADNGASHHICPDKSKFTSMAPYTGISRIHTLNGSMEVTQVGTVELIVDGSNGKQFMVLEIVLFQEESQLHIYSLQQARKQHYYYTFNQASKGKIRQMEQLSTGSVLQVALMTEELGKWTLDVHSRPPPIATSTSSLQPLPIAETVPSSGLSQPTCYARQLGPQLVALDNSFSGRFDVKRSCSLPGYQLPHASLPTQQE